MKKVPKSQGRVNLNKGLQQGQTAPKNTGSSSVKNTKHPVHKIDWNTCLAFKAVGNQNAPEILQGDDVICHPTDKPKSGNFVVFQTAKHGWLVRRCLFKGKAPKTFTFCAVSLDVEPLILPASEIITMYVVDAISRNCRVQ